MNNNLNNSSLQDKQENTSQDNVKIIQTDEGAKDGQNKCPKCGSTDISLNINNGYLRCNYCRYEFKPEKVVGLEDKLENLEGEVIGSGAQNIVAGTEDVKTFKCSSCGAEVVIDTSQVTQARCHWCRNFLSINQQIPNGSIPDVVLPFKVSKEEAQAKIKEFVGQRKFFAHPKFVKEFTTDNIMGVYFPYMLIDANSHANFYGQGEHLTRKYYRGSGDNRRAYYDADLYEVQRDFDLTINGLSIESSLDKLNYNATNKTNNIINAIMPFDVENSVKWNANYLKGYTSEKRDTNINQLQKIAEVQIKDVARFSCNNTIENYDRGVVWSSENVTIKGKQWQAAYLPVWLYSYQQVKKNKSLLHYVAVNARTKETMGSVPIHMPKLIGISAIIEVIGIMAMLFIDWEYNWLFALLGLIFFIIMFLRYRNSNARHKYETETKTKMTNLKKEDNFIEHKRGLCNAQMNGANNHIVNGQTITNKIYDSMSEVNIKEGVVNMLTENNPVASFIKDNLERKNDK